MPSDDSRQIAAPEAEETILSPTKQLALARLVAGDTVSAAAHHAGIHRATLFRWLRDDPVFVAELNRCHKEMLDSVNQGLRLLSAKAVRTLSQILSSRKADVPLSVKLRAAEIVLHAATAQQPGPIDPDDIRFRHYVRDCRKRMLGTMTIPSSYPDTEIQDEEDSSPGSSNDATPQATESSDT